MSRRASIKKQGQLFIRFMIKIYCTVNSRLPCCRREPGVVLSSWRSGMTRRSWSGRPVGPIQIHPSAASSVGKRPAAGSPDRSRGGGEEPGRSSCWWAPSLVRSALLDKELEGVFEGSLILLGMNCLRAADCDLAERNFSTTELTASPNSPVWEMGASRRKTFSFSRISVRLRHRWCSAATEPAIERPNVCLVAMPAWPAAM